MLACVRGLEYRVVVRWLMDSREGSMRVLVNCGRTISVLLVIAVVACLEVGAAAAPHQGLGDTR